MFFTLFSVKFVRLFPLAESWVCSTKMMPSVITFITCLLIWPLSLRHVHLVTINKEEIFWIAWFLLDAKLLWQNFSFFCWLSCVYSVHKSECWESSFICFAWQISGWGCFEVLATYKGERYQFSPIGKLMERINTKRTGQPPFHVTVLTEAKWQ